MQSVSSTVAEELLAFALAQRLWVEWRDGTQQVRGGQVILGEVKGC